jgi:hypothetical protein
LEIGQFLEKRTISPRMLSRIERRQYFGRDWSRISPFPAVDSDFPDILTVPALGQNLSSSNRRERLEDLGIDRFRNDHHLADLELQTDRSNGVPPCPHEDPRRAPLDRGSDDQPEGRESSHTHEHNRNRIVVMLLPDVRRRF